MEGSASLSSLLCEEDESCLNETNMNLNLCSVSESDDEYIQMLIQRESTFESNSYEAANKNWFKCARIDAIQWTLNARATLGFQFRTAYLSVTYFDRFFSRRSIDNGKVWVIRLLSVACLSLAAKMEECKVPLLSEYYVEDYNFEGNVIKRMELLVLDALEWKMGSVTPFTYIHYFVTKLCANNSRTKELVSKTIELILSITKVISVMDHRPSIIAAAAVLAALDNQLTRKSMEVKISVISSFGSLEKEIEMGKNTPPKSLISPKLLSTHSSSADALENSSITSVVGIKRKLTYNDTDQHCPLQKIHRSW